MRIYNKKGFYIGLFWLVMTIAELFMFAYHGMKPIEAVFCLSSLVLAVFYLSRSLSRNMSAEDTDELTEYILSKARSKAFTWSKGLCILFIVYFIFLYSWIKKEIYIVLFVAFVLMLIGMIIIEGITELYYQHKVEK